MWPLFLSINIFSSAAVSLSQRKVALQNPSLNATVNWLYYAMLFVPLPFLGFWGVSVLSWQTYATLLAGTFIFPIYNVISFKANHYIDAGLTSILDNSSSLLTIFLAVVLLGESFSTAKAIGFIFILCSALLATYPTFKSRSTSALRGIALTVVAITIFSAGAVYQKWVISKIGLVDFIFYDWELQAVWMTVISRPTKTKVRRCLMQSNKRDILTFVSLKCVRSYSFIISLALMNASVLSSYRSIVPALVVVAGIVVLGEKSAMKHKIFAAILGSIGLLVLSLG